MTENQKGKSNLIRGTELKACQPSLSRCTYVNRPLLLLLPFKVTQEHTPDEKETISIESNFIEKPVRPCRVPAQKTVILRRPIVEYGWLMSLWGMLCKHKFKL